METTNSQQDVKAIVAAFDFDGTLTTGDTFLAFIRFTHGRRRLFIGFLRHAHLLLMMKLGFYPNGKVKEKVFCHFYKGVSHRQFIQWGRRFADVAGTMQNRHAVETLQQHLSAGHMVCVVTASIDEWVRPVSEQLGVDTLLATRVEVSADGTLTGRFLSPNCNGAQKVARFLEVFPHRETYLLYAYGDSKGDNELLAFADRGFEVRGLRMDFVRI